MGFSLSKGRKFNLKFEQTVQTQVQNQQNLYQTEDTSELIAPYSVPEQWIDQIYFHTKKILQSQNFHNTKQQASTLINQTISSQVQSNFSLIRSSILFPGFIPFQAIINYLKAPWQNTYLASLIKIPIPFYSVQAYADTSSLSYISKVQTSKEKYFQTKLKEKISRTNYQAEIDFKLEIFQQKDLNRQPNLKKIGEQFGLHPVMSVLDQKGKELKSYVEDLIQNYEWKQKSKSDWFSFSSISESKYNTRYPIIRARIECSGYIPLQTILNTLNQPKRRIKWDPNIDIMEIIQGSLPSDFTSYRAIDSFLYSGDFAERKMTGILDDSIVSISYSVEHPKVKGFIRGTTIFSYFRIYYEEDKTVFQLIDQTDAGFKIGSFLSGLFSFKLSDWSRKFVRALVN